MISYIEGQVISKDSTHAIVKNHGIGYHIAMAKTDIDALTIGSEVELFIHTHVRQDLLELYGFDSKVKRQLFLLLIGASKIGPKIALAMLATITPSQLLTAIINKDVKTLAMIPGVGQKTAERMAIELKDKALKLSAHLPSADNTTDGMKYDLEQAIRSLGYNKAQSDKAISSIGKEEFVSSPLEALIKRALTILSGSIAS